MNAKEITVGYTYTKNLGNYENVKVDASATITVEPGEDIDELHSKAYEQTRRQIRNGLKKFQEGGF